jgi:hypothetical protein
MRSDFKSERTDLFGFIYFLVSTQTSLIELIFTDLFICYNPLYLCILCSQFSTFNSQFSIFNQYQI